MKKVLIIVLTLVTGVILSTSSCSKVSGSNTCDTTNLTYRQDILPILKNYCFTCHSNGNMTLSNNTGYNFQQGDSLGYAYFKYEGGIVIPNIRHDPGYIGMPYLQPKLLDCEVEKIVAWFNTPSLPY